MRLENIQSEKYGRILADVYVGDIHVNDLLIKERYAVKYDGGTKKKPESWTKYRLNEDNQQRDGRHLRADHQVAEELPF